MDETEKYERTNDCVNEIFDHFWDQKRGVILENVSPNGDFSDTFEGRLVNPGHGLEAMWFIMDLGVKFDRKDWIDKAVLSLSHTHTHPVYEGVVFCTGIQSPRP